MFFRILSGSMKCLQCGSEEIKVIDKRDATDRLIKRRRECISCGNRFSTFERLVDYDFVVLKKDGRKEKYDREKLRRGLIYAAKKRPILISDIDNIVRDVERQLIEIGEGEIEYDYIGTIILEKLKELDPVSYVRFFSVFKNFETIDEFMTLIRK